MPTSYATPPSSMIELEGSGKLTINSSGVSGNRKFRVNYSDLNHALGFLLGAINQTSSDEIVDKPQPWPGIPSLLVDDIEAVPTGQNGNSSVANSVIPSEYYRLEVNYKTAAYEQLSQGDKEKPENEDYLIQEVDYSCDTVIVPMKLTSTKYDTTSSTREIKHYIRLPRIEYSVTIPKVRFPSFSLIQELNGKINNKVVFGGAIGTVLFDGPKLSNTIGTLTDPAWKFNMKFIYNPKGWNKQLHPETLEWVAVSAIDGGTRVPYESADLTRLWTRKPA
jgi:hypothetical protein